LRQVPVTQGNAGKIGQRVIAQGEKAEIDAGAQAQIFPADRLRGGGYHVDHRLNAPLPRHAGRAALPPNAFRRKKEWRRCAGRIYGAAASSSAPQGSCPGTGRPSAEKSMMTSSARS